MSNKEQLSSVLSHPQTLIIQEDLIAFVECDTGTTGLELAKKITSSLRAFGLDLRYLRGQAYGRIELLALYLHW